MVFLNLLITVQSENIQRLFVPDTKFRWYLRIKCTNCNQEFPNEIYFTEEDTENIKGSRGNANFVVKCKECNCQATISILKESPKLINCVSGNDTGILAIFECRGLDLISWDPKNQFSCQVEESNTIFNDLDLTDLWCEYDEATQKSCQIEKIEQKFEKNNKIK